jgi:2-phospho-L-lactate/phosphoenolpyruvate guanylyltransferase
VSTLAILPVKSFGEAKQRLGAEYQPGARRALAESMFADVLTALRRTDGITSILVVTGDITAERLGGGYGAKVVVDREEQGQTHAAQIGLRRALDQGFERVVLVPSDTPALVPAELESLITPRAGTEALIVPDRHGTGTNALVLSPPSALEPAFGPDSRARHVQLAEDAGVAYEIVEVPSLALDVDTPDDLAALRERFASTRGGAAHTRGLLGRLDRLHAPA